MCYATNGLVDPDWPSRLRSNVDAIAISRFVAVVCHLLLVFIPFSLCFARFALLMYQRLAIVPRGHC